MGRGETIETAPSKLVIKNVKKEEGNILMEEQILEFQNYRNNIAGTPTDVKKNHRTSLQAKVKDKARTLFVSATPANYELDLSPTIVEQIIRPTGLLDPVASIYPKS